VPRSRRDRAWSARRDASAVPSAAAADCARAPGTPLWRRPRPASTSPACSARRSDRRKLMLRIVRRSAAPAAAMRRRRSPDDVRLADIRVRAAGSSRRQTRRRRRYGHRTEPPRTARSAVRRPHGRRSPPAAAGNAREASVNDRRARRLSFPGTGLHTSSSRVPRRASVHRKPLLVPAAVLPGSRAGTDRSQIFHRGASGRAEVCRAGLPIRCSAVKHQASFDSSAKPRSERPFPGSCVDIAALRLLPLGQKLVASRSR